MNDYKSDGDAQYIRSGSSARVAFYSVGLWFHPECTHPI
jgi:hypothetical protein